MNYKVSIEFDIESHKRVFGLILKYRGISGAQLSRITGLQKSSLLYILRALEDRSLIRVQKNEPKRKERGRPSTLYEVNSELFSIIGVELLPGSARVVRTDLQGDILNSWIVTLESIDTLSLELEKIIEQYSVDNILGVGVSLPGIVDSGTIVNSKPLNLEDYPIKQKLEEALGLFVRVNNDAKAGVLSAYLLSEDLDNSLDNILYFSVNLDFRGIGAGILINGKLYNGATGQSGEIYKKLPSISNPSNYLIGPEGEAIAREIGQIIVNTSQIINPDYIEIGGDIVSHTTFLNTHLNPEIARIQNRQYCKGLEKPQYKFSKNGDFSNALGGASLILHEVIR